VLHELFGRLALDAQLFAILWSDELLAETKRVLIERKPVDEPVAERWVRYLRDAFPEGRVTPPDEHPVDLATVTSDPDDEHVCALALASAPSRSSPQTKASTPTRSPASRSRSPAPTSSSPRCATSSPTSSLRVAERQARAWRGRPLVELLDAYQRAGTRLARQLRRLSET
jgi:hypothetical protein